MMEWNLFEIKFPYFESDKIVLCFLIIPHAKDHLFDVLITKGEHHLSFSQASHHEFLFHFHSHFLMYITHITLLRLPPPSHLPHGWLEYQSTLFHSSLWLLAYRYCRLIHGRHYQPTLPTPKGVLPHRLHVHPSPVHQRHTNRCWVVHSHTPCEQEAQHHTLHLWQWNRRADHGGHIDILGGL